MSALKEQLTPAMKDAMRAKDSARLKKVYPTLKKNFEFHVNRYMMDDDLFYGDTFL